MVIRRPTDNQGIFLKTFVCCLFSFYFIIFISVLLFICLECNTTALYFSQEKCSKILCFVQIQTSRTISLTKAQQKEHNNNVEVDSVLATSAKGTIDCRTCFKYYLCLTIYIVRIRAPVRSRCENREVWKIIVVRKGYRTLRMLCQSTDLFYAIYNYLIGHISKAF